MNTLILVIVIFNCTAILFSGIGLSLVATSKYSKVLYGMEDKKQRSLLHVFVRNLTRAVCVYFLTIILCICCIHIPECAAAPHIFYCDTLSHYGVLILAPLSLAVFLYQISYTAKFAIQSGKLN